MGDLKKYDGVALLYQKRNFSSASTNGELAGKSGKRLENKYFIHSFLSW